MTERASQQPASQTGLSGRVIWQSETRGIILPQPRRASSAPDRRDFLSGLAAALILPAPAIVRARSLMPVRVVPPISRKGLNFASALFLHSRDNAIAKLVKEGCPFDLIDFELFRRGAIANNPNGFGAPLPEAFYVRWKQDGYVPRDWD